MICIVVAWFTVVRILPIYSSINYIGNLPILFLFKTAVLPDNICTSVFQRKDDLDPLLATLPPCMIERKVTVDGVEYPIVRSQPIPPYDLDLNDTHIDTGFYLNNLNYSTFWPSTRIWSQFNLLLAKTFDADLSWEKAGMDKSLRPPEFILGSRYDTDADIWMLGCCVCFFLSYLL